MNAQQPEPRVDVTEADLLEQQQPVAGRPDVVDQPSEGTSLPTPSDTADVADQLEQLEDVATEDDEDYPHEAQEY
ncbi:MAG: hypothetical protein HOQ18_14075 [Dermatophilaceae bacterium]|nr:hypothetical protein [Dermatophilaceae bacterium]